MEKRIGHGKNSFNPLRKFWHILGLVIPLAYYYDLFQFLSDRPDFTRLFGSLVLLALTVVMLVADLARLHFSGFKLWVDRIFGFLLKEEESGRINAMIPYFFSMFVLVLFFHKVIAVVASLYLIIGDPAAAYIGSRYGRHRFSNGKSGEGVLAFFVTGFASALLFITLHTAFFTGEDGSDRLFLLADGGGVNLLLVAVLVAGSFASAVVELFSGNALFGLIDDNLTVPLTGAIVTAASIWMFLPDCTVFLNPLDIIKNAPF